MIAKRIQGRQHSSSIARLVRYAINAQGGLDPRSWSRTADYILDLHAARNTQGEKVSGVRVTNCGTDDPAAATLLIEATQAANTRSKGDKTYHLVFSFRLGENPSQDTLHAIEDELCAAVGLFDHQRISAVHVNTDHLHVHVAINKVHPTGFQNIEPFYDKQRLMEACERLEIAYGLEHDHHGLDRREQKQRSVGRSKSSDEQEVVIGGQATAMETQSGLESLARYVARDVAPAILAATDWGAVHAALDQHGLRIKERGAGLVIGDEKIPLWVRANQCGREFSKKAMTDRLGPFTPPCGLDGDTTPAKEPEAHGYSPRPIHQHPASSSLFAQYQRERQTKLEERKLGLNRLRSEHASSVQHLSRWKATQRVLLKASGRGAVRKVMAETVREQAKLAAAKQRRITAQRRAELYKSTANPNWAGWLAVQAQQGNVDALAVLRSRVERRERLRGDLLTAERAEHAKVFILSALKPAVRRDGAMTYRTADGGMVVDRKCYVHAQKATAGAALVALSLAAEKFAGQALVVDGTDAFKHDVARLAGLHKLEVTFKDAGMEAARRLAHPGPLVSKDNRVAQRLFEDESSRKANSRGRDRRRTLQNEL